MRSTPDQKMAVMMIDSNIVSESRKGMGLSQRNTPVIM